jgi:hypothetical protein
MSARIARTIALGVGAGALVLSTAGPAFADDPVNPYKFSIANTWTAGNALSAPVDVDGVDPVLTCANYGAWTARVPGRQDAITVGTPSCTDATLSVPVTVTASAKKNAVIKLVSTTSPDGTKVVKTFVVKVTGKTGNPGKGNKP